MINKIYNTSLNYFKKEDYYPDHLHRIPQNSWKLVEWITKYSSLKGSSKLVSIQIAGYYNPKLGYSYPSYDDIMRETGLSYPTISRCIQDMKLSGEWFIISTASSPNSRHTNNRYFYLSPTPDSKCLNNEIGYTQWEPETTYSTIQEYRTYIALQKRAWKRWMEIWKHQQLKK